MRTKTDRTPKVQTTDQSRIGRYGVANSAGVIDIWEDGPAMSLREARKEANIASSGGWLGECWVVKFVPVIVIPN